MQHRRPRLSEKAKTPAAAGTAVLVAAAGVTVAQAGETSKKCAAFDTITLGKYYVNNNLWGQDKGVGTQCVWANSAKGKDSDVKSYAGSLVGRHWGRKVDKAATGLPSGSATTSR
ncbi:hypothetical protein [Streptomyces sp. IMTB 2501]|uniref:hypothetical protein n=1 Tax=Streptomyces sp. IMTB 2501 TaxID=1776340 RepID=UPI0021167772|nr:hypothetical protein [Streptomyces sp. IMTB 2501]